MDTSPKLSEEKSGPGLIDEEVIRQLIEVARAGANLRQVWRDKGHGGKEEVLAHLEIAKAVDALPDWILEE